MDKIDSNWFLFFTSLQGIALLSDEIFFHRKRGLRLWERVGHPLDTLTVLICLLWALLMPPEEFNTHIFILLAFFSCLFITKDEWIHTEVCTPAEHWLHAILFILHPLVLISVYQIWPRLHETSGRGGLSIAFCFLILLMTGMFLYQVIYWNLYQPRQVEDS